MQISEQLPRCIQKIPNEVTLSIMRFMRPTEKFVTWARVSKCAQALVKEQEWGLYYLYSSSLDEDKWIAPQIVSKMQNIFLCDIKHRVPTPTHLRIFLKTKTLLINNRGVVQDPDLDANIDFKGHINEQTILIGSAKSLKTYTLFSLIKQKAIETISLTALEALDVAAMRMPEHNQSVLMCGGIPNLNKQGKAKGLRLFVVTERTLSIWIKTGGKFQPKYYVHVDLPHNINHAYRIKNNLVLVTNKTALYVSLDQLNKSGQLQLGTELDLNGHKTAADDERFYMYRSKVEEEEKTNHLTAFVEKDGIVIELWKRSFDTNVELQQVITSSQALGANKNALVVRMLLRNKNEYLHKYEYLNASNGDFCHRETLPKVLSNLWLCGDAVAWRSEGNNMLQMRLSNGLKLPPINILKCEILYADVQVIKKDDTHEIGMRLLVDNSANQVLWLATKNLDALIPNALILTPIPPRKVS